MRDGIRQHLIEHVAGIGGRVFEPHAAGAETEKPYLVISQGTDSEESQWAGFRRIIEIWPYVSRTSFSEVDALCKSVVGALNDQIITDPETGEIFTCIYLGTAGADMVDEEWDAITRGLRFSVLALQPVQSEEETENDPWIEALVQFTEKILPEWKVYKNKWPLGYVKPSVMWRLENIEIIDKNSYLYEVRKTLVGHVLGLTKTDQAVGAVTIIEEAKRAIKISVDEQERRYITIGTARINMNANAITAGQINLTVSRITGRPQEEFAPINYIFSRRDPKITD